MRPLRRKPKPKPHVVITTAWMLHDPAADEREAQVEVRAWAAKWVAAIPLLPDA